MADRPYSRHYWEWADEYPELYESDAACSLWYRLVRLGDMAWPSAATLPVGTKPAALRALTAADLIRMVTKTTYKVRGMDKEREARSQSASNAARSRWGDANRNAPRNANRNAETMPSRDEPSKDETSRAGASDPVEAYYLLTTRAPKKAAMDWLERLTDEHGAGHVVETMSVVWAEKADPSSFLSDIEAELVIGARRADRDADDVRRKADQEDQRLEQERIDAMTPEQRTAARERFQREVAPIFGGLLKDMP